MKEIYLLVEKRRCEREIIAEIKRKNLGDLIAEKEGIKFWEEKGEIGDREKRGKPGRKRETREEKRGESWVLTGRFSHQGAIGILESLGFNWVLSFFSL
jgi:hypothetical protein